MAHREHVVWLQHLREAARSLAVARACAKGASAVLCVAFAMQGCSVPTPRITELRRDGVVRGRLIDSDTGLPMADVHIIARYTDDNGVLAHSEEVCYHIEYTTTGADGYYQFSTGRHHDPLVDAYKRGYTGARNPRYEQDRFVQVDGNRELRYFAVETDLRRGRIIKEESYATREEAERATRPNDFYLKLSSGSRAERVEDYGTE